MSQHQPVDFSSEMIDTWVALSGSDKLAADEVESMPDRIRRVQTDRRDLLQFYNISISPRKYERVGGYYADELESLFQLPFDDLSQQHKVDFILLRNFLKREQRQLELDQKAQKAAFVLLPFAPLIVSLCESRQNVEMMEGEKTAETLSKIGHQVCQTQDAVEASDLRASKQAAYKATQILDELRAHLHDFYRFYSSYDPMFDWWATTPWREADAAIVDYISVIQAKLAGLKPGSKEEIVGEPIGRDGLLVELEAEMIPYTPDELIKLAEEKYKWCEAQMITASKELGYGEAWKTALEYVKDQVVPPGQQSQLVLQLAREGTAFVQKHDLVTVPKISDETYRMFMMSAERQKESPFFLGGPEIIVSYPTTSMSHDFKKMVMRGNNKHFFACHRFPRAYSWP